MTTFADKIAELLEMPQDVVETEATAVLDQIRTWPITTEVRLGRFAYVLAALLQEPDPHVRRVRITEGISMKDGAA